MIRVGIVGYGHIGRGVETAVNASEDMRLAAVYTRREPAKIKLSPDSVSAGAAVRGVDSILDLKGKIDVMVLCGGSAKDLPEQGPLIARHFCTVDSFDTHAKIPEYYKVMNEAALSGLTCTTALISVGWDPGLFSVQRLFGLAVLPKGRSYTFWGRGVSQGHSDAVRRVDGVSNAVQYTVPIESAVNSVRGGQNPALSAGESHTRECYVVAAPDADRASIERDIKAMPDYFADYETKVVFVTEEELREKHSAMPHGGFQIRCGSTGGGTGDSDTGRDSTGGGMAHSQIIEYSLKLGSNPEFTGSVMAAYARAAVRLAREGRSGALTVFDVPTSYLLADGEREKMFGLL